MAGTGVAEDEDAAAGFWGDYQCDIPLRTLEAMLSQGSDNNLFLILPLILNVHY